MIRTVFRTNLLLIFFATGVWAQGGPPGATVSDILTFRENPGLFYAATNAGVFRSTDGGQTWSERNEGLLSLDLRVLAGTSPSVVYAGTNGAGAFRLRDGGPWEPINQGLGSPVIVSLGVDPTDPSVVYAGTRNAGIFKTTSGGDQWSAVNNGLAQLDDGTFEGDYRDLVIDPSDPQVVYAAHTSNIQPGVGFLFRTEDGGQQWVGSAGPPVFGLALSPEDSQTIYLGTNLGLLRSRDGGVNFENPIRTFVSIVDVVVDSSDAQTIYAASRLSGIAKSVDEGESWQLASNGLPATESLSLTLDLNDHNTVLFGTNGAGVFQSPDGAATWRLSSNGLNAADVRAVAVNPSDSSDVLAAIFGGGLFQSGDGGESWRESRDGLTTARVSELAFDPQNPSVVYAGSINPFDPNRGNPFFRGDGAFFRSTDGGATWQEVVRPIAVTALAVHPTDGRTVYFSSDIGVFRSQDGGQTFEARNGDELIGFDVLDLAIDPSRPETLYAIITDPTAFFPSFGIMRTEDGGDDWDSVGGFSPISLNAITVDPTNSDRVYVGATGGFFRSTNRGDDFDDKNDGLPGDGAVAISSIVVDANDNGAIYMAASGAVFKSTNRGDSWSFADSGLEQFFVRALAVDPRQRGVLYAATTAGGLFKSTNEGMSWEPTAAVTAPVPFITASGVVNAADFSGGGVAPGEIISIFGQNMGPTEGILAQFDAETGLLPSEAAGITVFFGEIPAPLFFVRADQINAQVPFEVAGMESVEVRVVTGEAAGNTVSVPVVESHPGVFNTVLNQDFSLNSAENPAAPRSFVSLFVTGQGLVDPAIMTGAPAPSAQPFPSPVLSVSAEIGGNLVSSPAAVLAPGFVGLLQVNAQVPAEIPSGANDVFVTIGEATNQNPISVFIQ